MTQNTTDRRILEKHQCYFPIMLAQSFNTGKMSTLLGLVLTHVRTHSECSRVWVCTWTKPNKWINISANIPKIYMVSKWLECHEIHLLDRIVCHAHVSQLFPFLSLSLCLLWYSPKFDGLYSLFYTLSPTRTHFVFVFLVALDACIPRVVHSAACVYIVPSSQQTVSHHTSGTVYACTVDAAIVVVVIAVALLLLLLSLSSYS